MLTPVLWWLSQSLICVSIPGLGKPPPQFPGEQSGTRSGPVGTRDTRFRAYKTNPVSSTEVVSSSSSSPGNPPTTVPSNSPFGSVKKGKAIATAQSYSSERAPNSKRKQGGVGDPIDTVSQQVCYSFPIHSQYCLFGTSLPGARKDDCQVRTCFQD